MAVASPSTTLEMTIGGKDGGYLGCSGDCTD